MRSRTLAEVRLLMDAAQIALAVGAVLALALPWWVDYDLDGDIATSGWGGLDTNALAQGWLLLVVVVVGLVATVTGSTNARVIAAGVAAVAAFFVTIVLLSYGDSSEQHTASGVWIGLGLVVATGVVQAYAAFAPGSVPASVPTRQNEA